MYCHKCGAKLDNDATFCSRCGTRVGSYGNSYEEAYYQPIKKSKAPIFIILVIIIVVALAVIAGFFMAKSLERNKNIGQASQMEDIKKSNSIKKTEPAKDALFEVQQVDVSAFPKVKVYVNIKDANTGEVPSNLDETLFYLKRKDINAKFEKKVIKNVKQLNEEESLKVDMVADVSGSMSGEPLSQAKNVMNRFLDSVQFEAGDEVELTSFATGVRLEQEFTNKEELLKNCVDYLFTEDMTSLYDALYTAVQRVAAQNGAKCVIAFTDGEDNNSSCSAENVIEAAQRYHIPIFVIGIGSADYTRAAQIAEQTGGRYYSVESVISMEDIYAEIYRMEKEMYVIEYEETVKMAESETIEIQIGYKGTDYIGECNYSYIPTVLSNVNSDTLYTDGPEAVVEGYMKGFAQAVTYSDFSYIEKYMLFGSDLYNEQIQYVKKDIAEQLDSYEIVNTTYSDSNHCIVRTRETYYIQKPNKPLQLMTQQCDYDVVRTNGNWKMISFADFKVLSRINK